MSATLNKFWQRSYGQFIENCSDPNKELVTVFPALSAQQLSELYLIRELSVELQKKKDEDLKKAAEAVEEAVKVQEEENKTSPENDDEICENDEDKSEKES